MIICLIFCQYKLTVKWGNCQSDLGNFALMKKLCFFSEVAVGMFAMVSTTWKVGNSRGQRKIVIGDWRKMTFSFTLVLIFFSCIVMKKLQLGSFWYTAAIQTPCPYIPSPHTRKDALVHLRWSEYIFQLYESWGISCLKWSVNPDDTTRPFIFCAVAFACYLFVR